MISLKDIKAAKERIAPYTVRTPLLRVPALDPVLGCEVYLKHEGFQRTGSFKLRGAANKVVSLDAGQKEKGIVCASSGNHAQGVACIAQMLGIDAVVVMPTDANPMKLAGVKSYGANALLVGTLGSEREAKAAELAAGGRTLVHPYDDDMIRAGQGTIGLEVLEDQPGLDVVAVPIGGGGLISGVSTAVKESKPSIRVIGMEPAVIPRYAISRERKKVVSFDQIGYTVADGTRTNHSVEDCFKIIEKNVDELVVIEDPWILKAIRLLAVKAKIVVEPSSVMGVAAALKGTLPVKREDKVCFVLSGGNIDLSLLADVLSKDEYDVAK